MKKCKYCSTPLEKRDNEKPCRFRVRVYCNTHCHHNHGTEKADVYRTCQACGEQYGRRRQPNGRLATITKFRHQLYCSQECYRKTPHSWHNRNHFTMPVLWEPWEMAKELE